MPFIRDHSPDEKLFRALLKGLIFQRIQNPGRMATDFAEWIDARIFDYSRIGELSTEYSAVWTTRDEDFCRRQHEPQQWIDWLRTLHERFTVWLLRLVAEKAAPIRERLPRDADLNRLRLAVENRDPEAISSLLLQFSREYRQAASLFIHDYGRKCFDHVRRNGSQDPDTDARDLLTLVFRKFLKQIEEGKYPSKSKLGAHLQLLIVNTWTDEYLRKKRPSRALSGIPAEWSDREKAAFVKAGLERLAEPCRSLLHFRMIGKLDWRDVAASHELTEAQAQSLYGECLEALRMELTNLRP